ncbi:transglutaminase family protein [Nocardioidaceae bacterium]|nr:transglutaminase family protein [Nocardioidaceae bacterium]
MAIKVALEHRTTYTFDRRVQLHPHTVRLRPAPHTRTAIEAYTLDVSPGEHFLNWQQDPYGNHLARLVFPERTDHLEVTVGLVADLQVVNPFDFFVEEYAEHHPFTYPGQLAGDLEPYLRPVAEPGAAASSSSGPGPLATAFTAGIEGLEGQAIVDFLVRVNQAVHEAVAYTIRLEPGVQSPDETLEKGIGSCRDSAWLLVSVLRQLGVAARFVSGYLVQLTSDQASLDGPDGPAADFTDLHAWTEAFVPGAGWIGLDPTSSLFAGEGHIPLSATPHPSSAAPISGALEPCEVSLDFANVVTRFHEDPRVTLPYTDEQWARVREVGAHVDDRLAAADVPLTMGGEPTFVSIDDMTSAQWNTTADGEEKRELAGRLAERLRVAFGRGALVQRGQGKWYPGEPLPRWQIGLLWRTDGIALWRDPSRLADPWGEEPDEDAPAVAERLARRLTEALGLPPEQLHPAYEDPLERVAAALRLPDGEAPDGEPRADDVAAMDEGEDPVAWVLPLHPLEVAAEDEGAPASAGPSTEPDEAPAEAGSARRTEDVGPSDRAPKPSAQRINWGSPTWRFRRGRLVLLPGTSPAGLRLPLSAVAWEPPEPTPEPSWFHTPAPLEGAPVAAVPVPVEDAPLYAVAVEPREGFVHVFLPPTDRLEDFTGLVEMLDRLVTEIDARVVVEGYGPPPDPRVTNLMVTPDPGVIEVNLQPTSSWEELVAVTETLYEEARQCRLGTEKFDLDGLHTGTGGGNHLTLGGATPEVSPMLTRPDLLVSLLTWWQHHPSLSYLFSGRFVGPTSQAPRVDEGRPEQLYELEISFAEIEDQVREDGTCPPWIVDRALRHLLTDLTGNTHRAEFCIDKLYSPDSSRGRLGLLELRGFEMPPHPRMGLAQALLVRALVARFAEEPYTAPLVRWGTELHERFLLPWGAESDLAAVLRDLRAHGFELDDAWYAPFLEFRFPRIGTTQLGGLGGPVLELRQAVEPWMVLGEESAVGGTSRFVDSSVERIQVTVDGALEGRHVVTCNGVPVPLVPSGRTGQLVAGVRYRAWQPPSALHPTIEVQAPLTFEVVDLAQRRSLGGCRYHVTHPGGRSYDTPPVNAAEAESRRAARFEHLGHTPGEIDVAALTELARTTRAPEYPFTLDLRRRTPRRWGG